MDSLLADEMLSAYVTAQESVQQQARGAARIHEALDVLADASLMPNTIRQRIRHISTKGKGGEAKQSHQGQRERCTRKEAGESERLQSPVSFISIA